MAEVPHSLRIFLCHSSSDKQAVRELYQRLCVDGFDPWLDEENLLPGQDWQREIPEAVNAADVVLVCLSRSSLTKRGYVQKEIKYALDVADKQPEDTIYLIPIKLEECDIPERLRRLHWVSLFEPMGYERLLSALRHRSAAMSAKLEADNASSSDQSLPLSQLSSHEISPEEERTASTVIGLSEEAQGDKAAAIHLSTTHTARPLPAQSDGIRNKYRLIGAIVLVLGIFSLIGSKYWPASKILRIFQPGIPLDSTAQPPIAANAPQSSATTAEQSYPLYALRQSLNGLGNNNISLIEFSPDGNTLASGSWDKTVTLWDVQTGAVRHTLAAKGHFVVSIKFSPDGELLASQSYGSGVELWDVHTGALKHSFNISVFIGDTIRFSPDGRTLACGGLYDVVRLWDVQTGALKRTLVGHRDSVESIAFSPDGKLLASASQDKTIKLWDVQTGALKRSLNGHTNVVTSTAFSPDGKLLASASWDETVKLWDVETGVLVRTLMGHEENVWLVIFSPDGNTLASRGMDKMVKLWDVRTGALRQTVTATDGHVIDFSPDSKTLATGSTDKTVKLWDIRTGELKQTLTGHQGDIKSVKFSPQGKILATGSLNDKNLKLWQAE